MFSVFCPGHDSEVLLTPRSIDEITNTPNGIELKWHCPCGSRGTVLTGWLRQSA
jgi:hypothetical protein